MGALEFGVSVLKISKSFRAAGFSSFLKNVEQTWSKQEHVSLETSGMDMKSRAGGYQWASRVKPFLCLSKITLNISVRFHF